MFFFFLIFFFLSLHPRGRQIGRGPQNPPFSKSPNFLTKKSQFSLQGNLNLPAKRSKLPKFPTKIAHLLAAAAITSRPEKMTGNVRSVENGRELEVLSETPQKPSRIILAPCNLRKGKLANGSGGRLRKRICFAQRGLLSGLAFAFYSYFPRKGQVLFLNPCSQSP